MNHVTEALARVTQQYKDADGIKGIITANATQSQAEEDALQSILVKEMFDVAAGEQLDVWGVILNVPRGAYTDTDYRARLRVRIAEINSEGTIPDMISIFQQMTNASKVELHQYFPASFSLLGYSVPVLPKALINLISGSPMSSARITVANSDGWGTITGATFLLDVDTYPILGIIVDALHSSTIVLGITDVTDPNNPVYYRINSTSIYELGYHHYNISTITGMTGNRKIFISITIEALTGDYADVGRILISNVAKDVIIFDEDFTVGVVGQKPAGWFDSRGGVAPLYTLATIREAIQKAKAAGVGFSLAIDTELPAFSFLEYAGPDETSGFDDGTGTVGGTFVTAF